MSSWLIHYSTQFILNKLNLREGLTHVLIGNRNDSLIDRRSFNYDVLSKSARLDHIYIYLSIYSSDDHHNPIRYFFRLPHITFSYITSNRFTFSPLT